MFLFTLVRSRDSNNVTGQVAGKCPRTAPAMLPCVQGCFRSRDALPHSTGHSGQVTCRFAGYR